MVTSSDKWKYTLITSFFAFCLFHDQFSKYIKAFFPKYSFFFQLFIFTFVIRYLMGF